MSLLVRIWIVIGLLDLAAWAAILAAVGAL